jgi:hypothetical protein
MLQYICVVGLEGRTDSKGVNSEMSLRLWHFRSFDFEITLHYLCIGLGCVPNLPKAGIAQAVLAFAICTFDQGSNNIWLFDK